MSDMSVLPNGKGDPQAQPRFSGYQVWILMGLGVVVLCVYGVLGAAMASKRGQPAPNVQISAVDEPLTLDRAHEQALALASGWQPDVQLVSAATSWQLASGDRLTLYRPAWSFRFYSPAVSQVQLVTVDKKGAQASRQIHVRTAPSSVEADWTLGSDELLLTLMAHGGEDFLRRNSHVNVHCQLKREDAGRSIWYLTTIDSVARQSLTVGVDALSRQVVVQG